MTGYFLFLVRAYRNRCVKCFRYPRGAVLAVSESMLQAEAEGLTLLVADNKTGYLGVYLTNAGRPKPYAAQVKRGGKMVSLGSFATAEEAALCIARSPEGQAAAKRAAAPPPAPPLTSEEVRQQTEAEGLTLRVAENKTGYFGVVLVNPGQCKPYQAKVWRGGKVVYLGRFATAEEAALHVARSPEGREAAKQAAAAPPLTSEEARQQARAEGLTLIKADNTTGYFGVYLISQSGQPKPYEAQVRRGGKQVSLGCFVTAEEAALCVARSPEGRAAAERAASAPQPRRSGEGGHGSAPATRSRAVLKQEGTVPPMPPGAFVKEEVVVPPMPPDAVVKREHTVVVKEEECSHGRAKRRRSK